MNTRRSLWSLMLVLALVALAAPGCIFSPDDSTGDGGGGGGAEPYPWPSTQDQLMANFQRAYDEMDIDAYRDEILHPDYKFVFIEGSDLGGPTGYWTREDELLSAQAMFSGEPHTNSNGEVAPGISDITFDVLDRVDPWQPVPPDDPYFAGPGAWKALFNVHLVLRHDGGTYTISSPQIFVVIPVEVDDGTGATRTRWMLYGQQDLESGGK